MVASYDRIMKQCLDKSQTLGEFEKNVVSFKKVGLVPIFLENKFIDLKIKFIHQSFAKQLSSEMLPYLQVPVDQHPKDERSHDKTIYELMPASLQGTFFNEIIKSSMKLYEASGEESALRRAKYSIYNAFNVCHISELAYLHKSLLLEAYEELGAGVSYNPSPNDQPARYKHLTKEEAAEKSCQWEVSLVKAAEEIEATYNFAAEIRQAKLAEKERNMREFEERVRRLKERQAEFYKNKQLNQTST